MPGRANKTRLHSTQSLAASVHQGRDTDCLTKKEKVEGIKTQRREEERHAEDALSWKKEVA